ncbi:MAG TPA: glutamate formimidoyltransferase [Candidatus Limnocylindrales bacterium]|nr:glutamate formimidoyltransferase [Candidatus Limnocylindrales bacterium]
MAKLVECVPNFSEGRRTEVVDALAEAVESTPGAHLLDRTSDVDHNRSVLTFAGEAEPVAVAMEAAVAVALEQIDMERHEGQHPRIGAVDVVPFVPLGETTMAEAVDLARRFGQRIAERFELPVYLYARAATRPEREVLADIRRPQYEGLKESIVQRGREPDFGPARTHPRGGAVAVGARPFLIAYNINLDANDVELAKRIAHRIRERSGGLPRVQALGLPLEELGCAQVSMNLLDHAVTPIWRVWEEVERLASDEGVGLRESELIGLAPLSALTDVADHIGVPKPMSPEARISEAARWLRIRDFEPTMALELRLAAVTAPAET